MRRTREWTIEHYIIAAVPVLVVVVGVYHWTHRGVSDGRHAAIELKDSKDGKDSKSHAFSEEEHKTAEHSSDEHSRSHGSKHAKHARGDSEDEGHWNEGEGHHPSFALEGASNDAVASGSDCAAIEYRGAGPQLTRVTKGEWNVVMDQFHAAKRGLASWLQKNRANIASDTSEAMERQLKSLKIQRPPVSDEPDLAWRGIGVFSQSPEGEPIVKLGGGFITLAATHPARAKFEMTRLVAQVWAPCELQKISALDTTWGPALKCLGVSERQDCGQGTYSEGGWAISTTLAAAVSAPGCQIPAFQSAEAASCVRAIPFNRAPAAAHAEHNATEKAVHSEHAAAPAEHAPAHAEHGVAKKAEHAGVEKGEHAAGHAEAKHEAKHEENRAVASEHAAEHGAEHKAPASHEHSSQGGHHE